MVAKVVNLPVPGADPTADERAQAHADRQQRLFEWAAAVLEELGLTEAVAAAMSKEELLAITLDVNSGDLELAVRDALHPAFGKRADHFRGLNEGSLKAMLKNCFADLKRDREAALRRECWRGEPDWTDDLISRQEWRSH